MKVPLSWLKEYVDLDLSVEALTDKLVFSGTEVEGIATMGAGLEDVVVGEVLAIEPHPNADRLRLCRVSDGASEYPVVCGAINFEVGEKIPFARAGVALPNGMKLKRAKIRGSVSEGMLCAEDELGLSEDHDGIMRLPRETPTGTPLLKVLDLPQTVLELEVTWNRSDCLSVLGVARELGALCESTMVPPPVEVPEAPHAAADRVSVTIEDAACSHYTARMLSNITLGPSPQWMQQRLEMCGLRPINNVVDITNYVMLECGQPLHAFDYARVKNGNIVVRRAQAHERLETLDGLTRELTPDMLVIADSHEPVALAGIMGGAGSEITENTTEVLLESAAFDPALTHYTSVALGISSESSHRFERGIDLDRVEWASRRAAQLMVELAGATVAHGVVECRPECLPRPRATCRYQRVRDLLGIEIDDAEIRSIFRRLQLPVVEETATDCTVEAPGFRHDIQIEADLIEEIARVHGLDRIPAAPLISRIVPDAADARSRAVSTCRHQVAGLGFRECSHYSFLAQALLDTFDASDAATRVVLPNPVSKEYAVLRNALYPQLVETLGRNLAHQTASAALFEIGRVYRRQSDGAICEQAQLCMGLMGRVGRTGPDGNRPVSTEESFLWLKGAVEQLLAACHVENVTWAPTAAPAFEPGQAVALLQNGREWGRLGILSADLRHKWRMTAPPAIVEMELDVLCRAGERKPALKPLPVYPGIRRDMALVVSSGVSHGDIERTIWKSAPPELTDVTLFDIFSGEGLEAGQVSLAYALLYRSLQRSLTDEEANGFHNAVKKALQGELQVTLREA